MVKCSLNSIFFFLNEKGIQCGRSFAFLPLKVNPFCLTVQRKYMYRIFNSVDLDAVTQQQLALCHLLLVKNLSLGWFDHDVFNLAVHSLDSST